MGSSLLSAGKSVMLGHLQQLAEIALHGSPAIGTAVEDLVLVVTHALAAERQADEVVFDKDELGRHVELLCMLATLERLRRLAERHRRTSVRGSGGGGGGGGGGSGSGGDDHDDDSDGSDSSDETGGAGLADSGDVVAVSLARQRALHQADSDDEAFVAYDEEMALQGRNGGGAGRSAVRRAIVIDDDEPGGSEGPTHATVAGKAAAGRAGDTATAPLTTRSPPLSPPPSPARKAAAAIARLEVRCRCGVNDDAGTSTYRGLWLPCASGVCGTRQHGRCYGLDDTSSASTRISGRHFCDGCRTVAVRRATRTPTMCSALTGSDPTRELTPSCVRVALRSFLCPRPRQPKRPRKR